MAFDLSTWATAKYRYSFVGDEGTSYIAEIHEDGFSGSVATVDIVGRGSINTRWATEGDDEFAPMMTSETSLALYDTGEALASDLIDALDTVDNKYLMVIRQSGSLKWVGRIDPESINFDEDGPVKLSVTATDGLGRLENKPYISSTDGSSVDEGSATLVSVIADVLSGIGFGLDFYISSSLVPRAGTAITATQNPLEYVWVNKIAFTSNRDKEERGLVSKLSVLQAICKAWGLRIFQANGAWHLIQVSHLAQNSHRKWQYNSAGTLQGYSDVDPRVTISDENVKRSESTANILPGYKSSIVQYQHGPIRLLRSPQFEPLTISDAEAIFGGNYPWSQYIGAAQIYTLDDGTWGMGVDEVNVTGGLSGKVGYDGIEIDDKGVVFANIPNSTLSPLIGNGFSAQTTDPIPDGVPLKLGAAIFGLQWGNNPNPNPHLVADEWVAFQVQHDGTTTRYLKFSADGSLEWSTTNNWCLIRNGLQPNGWASLSLDDIDNTVNNGVMTVRIGPVIYDDTEEALWEKVVWDNVQLFPELPDGQSNYDATSVVSYINNAARSEPRPVQRTVVLGDGPSTYNKGSMYTNSALTTITTDWEITTTGHSGSNTDVSHAEALGELMLRCMHRVRRKHNASYVGYGGILTPLNVLNRSSSLWVPWEITATWQGEYSQGSWYRAEYTSSLTNLETEAGIATGAHLLSAFGRGTSSNAGFTYNRIGSSFDTLVARENDRISKVTANASSGTTVSCEALADPSGSSLVLRHNDSIYFQSVKTGRIIKRLVDATGNADNAPYAAGATTFEVTDSFSDDEKIEVGDPILPGSITGMRIDLDGVSIINTHIKSEGTYAFDGAIHELTGEITDAGTTGWVISKSGGAVFNDIVARGSIVITGTSSGLGQFTDFTLSNIGGDLDNVDDGGTYKKVLGTSISAGQIILSQTVGDLDDISDGSIYVRATQNEVTGAGRAYTALNGSNYLVTAVAPGTSISGVTTAGLYLGTDYMGYFNGADWKTYMDGSGFFYLSGTNGSLVWNPSADTLEITGAVTATSGDFSGVDISGTLTIGSSGEIKIDATTGTKITKDQITVGSFGSATGSIASLENTGILRVVAYDFVAGMNGITIGNETITKYGNRPFTLTTTGTSQDIVLSPTGSAKVGANTILTSASSISDGQLSDNIPVLAVTPDTATVTPDSRLKFDVGGSTYYIAAEEAP